MLLSLLSTAVTIGATTMETGDRLPQLFDPWDHRWIATPTLEIFLVFRLSHLLYIDVTSYSDSGLMSSHYQRSETAIVARSGVI